MIIMTPVKYVTRHRMKKICCFAMAVIVATICIVSLLLCPVCQRPTGTVYNV